MDHHAMIYLLACVAVVSESPSVHGVSSVVGDVFNPHVHSDSKIWGSTPTQANQAVHLLAVGEFEANLGRIK